MSGANATAGGGAQGGPGHNKQKLARVKSAPLPLTGLTSAMDARRTRWQHKNLQTMKLREMHDPFVAKAREEKLGWRTAPEPHVTMHRELVLGRQGGGFGMAAELRALKESLTGVPTNHIRRPDRGRSADEDVPQWVEELRAVLHVDRDKAWTLYNRTKRVVAATGAAAIPERYRPVLVELLETTLGVPGSGATVLFGIEGVLAQWRRDVDGSPRPMPGKFKWTGIDLRKSSSLEERWLATAPHAKPAFADTQFEAHRMRVSAALSQLTQPLSAVMDAARVGDAERLLALARQARGFPFACSF